MAGLWVGRGQRLDRGRRHPEVIFAVGVEAGRRDRSMMTREASAAALGRVFSGWRWDAHGLLTKNGPVTGPLPVVKVLMKFRTRMMNVSLFGRAAGPETPAANPVPVMMVICKSKRITASREMPKMQPLSVSFNFMLRVDIYKISSSSS